MVKTYGYKGSNNNACFALPHNGMGLIHVYKQQKIEMILTENRSCLCTSMKSCTWINFFFGKFYLILILLIRMK